MRTLIEKATIMTMDNGGRLYPDGHVLFDENGILAVGSGACSQDADIRVDGRQGILMPGVPSHSFLNRSITFSS